MLAFANRLRGADCMQAGGPRSGLVNPLAWLGKMDHSEGVRFVEPEMTMNILLNTVLATCGLMICAQAVAQITLYQGEGWRGRAVSISNIADDLRRVGFNDRASSAVIERGRWEVCEDADFHGLCRVLQQGSYDSLAGMGLNDRISSVRPVRGYAHDDRMAPTPLPQPYYAYRQRPHERRYDARVTSVRAVVGPPEQRCWIERRQVARSNDMNNAGGAIVGALLGGVLGHQVGGGTGRDIATVGGALAGAAIGSNMGGDGRGNYGQDVRRCEEVASTTPAYWDVTYQHRGINHRVQLATEPGEFIQVNEDGLPRM